jgi:protein-disulfide isomerase
VELGNQLGISGSKFEGCVNEGKYQDWVNNVAADGSQKNVNATPTIFINGKEIERINANYFDAKTFENLVFGK